MPSILLVDDEFLARNAVLTLLGQDVLPACKVREAVNGREAVALIQHEVPDIALIDVSMPVMGGLALLQWIQENAPQIYCVMLSSYSDFEYVRNAMKNGARDYLLKHQLSAGGLLEVLRQSGVTIQAREPDAGVFEQRFAAYLTGEDAQADTAWAMDSLFFCLRLENAGERGSVNAQSLISTSRHILARENVALCAPHRHILAFAFPRRSSESQAQHKKRVLAAQQLLRSAIGRYHGLSVALQEPVRCERPEEMRNLYLSQLNVHAAEKDAFAGTPALAFENALTTAVLYNHQDAIAQLIHERFAQADRDEKGLDGALAELLRRCYGHLLHIDEPAYPRRSADASTAEYYARAFSTLARQYQQISYAGFPELIRKTLVYLNANSGRQISLSDVAAHLNINYSYLSYLFKKETGIGLNQYLNAVRVSNAMRLILLKSLPVSAAYEEAGFGRYGHFVATFKGVTGLSPTAFRKHPQAFSYMMGFTPLKPVALEVLGQEEE